jgi:predicted nucleic acid-binding protein
MNCVFADSFYFFALLNPKDTAHRRALEFSQQNQGPIVTTAWVLTELADGLAASANRRAFSRVVDRIRANSDNEIVPPTEELLNRGIALYDARPDKQWSLTDCISFVVMQERKLSRALTGDHHFEQAGFEALLRQ